MNADDPVGSGKIRDVVQMRFRNAMVSLLIFAGLALLSQNAAVAAATTNDGDNGQGQQIQLSDLAGTTAETGRG